MRYNTIPPEFCWMVNDSVECGKSAYFSQTYVIAGCRWGRLTNHVPHIEGIAIRTTKRRHSFLWPLNCCYSDKLITVRKLQKFSRKIVGDRRGRSNFIIVSFLCGARASHRCFFFFITEFSMNVWLLCVWWGEPNISSAPKLNMPIAVIT